jgi:hypothetical protein
MIERLIIKHWVALSVGCVLLGITIRITYEDRGHFAFGSEWAIIPLVFIVEIFIRNVRRGS